MQRLSITAEILKSETRKITMGRNGVTLKDIAERCSVSPTLVSAVLNHKNGRIVCSQTKREEIFAVAEQLNYKVNVLARSIRQRTVPIVGMLMYVPSKEKHPLSLHLNSYMTALTYTFNKNHLEVLYVPYSSEVEQLQRCQTLVGNGFSGGLITDIMPESHGRICSFLKNCGLPYMVLGYPDCADVHSAYMTTPVLDSMVMEKCRARGLTRCVQVTGNSDGFSCREYPFVDGCMWHTPVHPLSDETAQQEKTFYAFTGAFTYFAARNDGFSPENFIVYESEILMNYIPDNVDVIVIPDKTSDMQTYRMAAEVLSGWICKGQVPAEKTLAINDSGVKYGSRKGSLKKNGV